MMLAKTRLLSHGKEESLCICIIVCVFADFRAQQMLSLLQVQCVTDGLLHLLNIFQIFCKYSLLVWPLLLHIMNETYIDGYIRSNKVSFLIEDFTTGICTDNSWYFLYKNVLYPAGMEVS